jgi:hypothetical protein
MTTISQINANRENAKRSTGPRTAAGKANVRYNAMKHGLLAEAALLPDEDEATFREFVQRITTDLQPEGEMEAILAERIINTLWRLRRASQVEAGLFVWRSEIYRNQPWNAANPVQCTALAELGGTFALDASSSNAFTKLSRYETQLGRTLDKTLQQLVELQGERANRPEPATEVDPDAS